MILLWWLLKFTLASSPCCFLVIQRLLCLWRVEYVSVHGTWRRRKRRKEGEKKKKECGILFTIILFSKSHLCFFTFYIVFSPSLSAMIESNLSHYLHCNLFHFLSISLFIRDQYPFFFSFIFVLLCFLRTYNITIWVVHSMIDSFDSYGQPSVGIQVAPLAQKSVAEVT